MASAKHHSPAEEVEASAESCSYDGHAEAGPQINRTRSETAAARKRAVRCADCGKKFDGWRLLQQHKRKACPKSSFRLLCRECKAFFPSKVELNNHFSATHVKYSCEKVPKSMNINGSRKKFESPSPEECLVKSFKHEPSLKRKKVIKHPVKSGDLNRLKPASAYKGAKRVGKLRKKSPIIVGPKEHEKAVIETCTVGSNPFFFTTSCAPDAPSFQFPCQSCITVRFSTYLELRQHEDWCARVRSSHGFICLPCGRGYRNLATLRRHADEHHKMPVSSEVKRSIGNPFQFSTTIALDAASHPHVCGSCRLVCFTSSTLLRRHEDWCGQCSSEKDGSKCDKCGRNFRTDALLERHTASDDCLSTGNVAMDVDGSKANGGTELKNFNSEVKEVATPQSIIYSVCPLCDMQFISQYEQQVHFLNVHNLTSSEPKLTQSVPRHSRRGTIGTHVECLDCNLVLLSRLELAQHKRVCMKEKKFPEVMLPAVSPVPTSGNEQSTSIDGRSTEDSPKTDLKVKSTSTYGKGPLSKLFRSRSRDTEVCQKSEIPRELLLDTAKVRNLIRRTGAKQLLLEPDGELLLLREGGRKISTVNGQSIIMKTSRDCRHVETGRIFIGDGSEVDSCEKPNPVTSPTGDTESLPASFASDQSAISRKGLCFGEGLKTVNCISSENLETTADNRKLFSCEKKSGGETEDHFEPSCCETNHTVGEQHCASECSNKADHLKSLEAAETDSTATLKTCRNVGERRKLTRKRPPQNNTDVIDSGAENLINTEPDHVVENNIVAKKEPVSPNTRSKRSPDSTYHSDVTAANLLAPASGSEVKITESESDSGQQTLLEALQLVPVSVQLNRPHTVKARYWTRSSVNVAEAHPAKKGRHLDNSKETSRSSKSASQTGHALSTRTASKTVEINKHESADKTPINNESVVHKTKTVECVGDSLVRCIACKTIFRTVRQIADHYCARR